MFACETIAGHSARLGRANGFDLMRRLLALGIVIVHGFVLTTGNPDAMPGVARAFADLILPGFFALSGFLVAGSLARAGSLPEFLMLRLLRIIPALAVVLIATVLLLGPLLTALPLRDYFRDPGVPLYLYSQPHFQLPGLFESNPRAGVVNGSLWTIPLELTCYAMLGALALVAGGPRILSLLLAVFGLLLMFPTMPFAGLLLTWLPAKPLVLAFVCGALLFQLRGHTSLHPALGLSALAAALAVMPHSVAVAMPFLAYAVIWLSLRRVPAFLTRADYSYGFYLTAYPLQQTVISFLPQAPWWSHLLLAVPLALMAAAILWHGIEHPLLSRRREIVARLRGLTPVAAR